MYGKHFSTMYEGSMVGSGCHVFAVWGYCISNVDPDSHTVRLNPKLLATILGATEVLIQEAIAFLCSPDPDSQCTDEGGRRLLNTSGMEYLVVSHHHYREIKNGSDRREYMRKYMKNYRAKGVDNQKNVNNGSLQNFTKANPVSVSVNESVKEGMQGEIDPHAPVDSEKLKTTAGAVAFIKLHPAFNKTPIAGIENVFKQFEPYRAHWPMMCRQFQTDHAGDESLKYPPCQQLRIEFDRYIKFKNIASPFQSL